MRELERSPRRQATDDPAEPGALVIVGAGRVGSSLAATATRAGLRPTLARRGEALAACRCAQIALLCVGDEEIAAAAAEVAAAVPPLRLVGHVSGATRLDALDAAASIGASTFSIHPLQTVPDLESDLSGSPCAVAGSDAEALAFAESLAVALGMRPFAIDERARAAYHAAACIASNFLVALEESATSLLEAAGAEQARELISPLVLRTAANWSEHGDRALTGPIARGDDATVEAHLEALRERAPELVPLYEALAERARAIADRRDRGGR